VAVSKWIGEAQAIWEVPRDLLLRRYPAFVNGGPLPRGHVPVFVFHSVEPISFGRRLRYLAENRYVTLSAAEYLEVLAGTRPAPERAVVITFDDGRASVYTVAYPLLQRHGMKAVLFLVPGRLPSAPPRPTWDDVMAGRAAREAALGPTGEVEGFLSWEEVEVLSKSGLFDIESHSLTHARIHTEPYVVGFLTPEARQGYNAMDVPLIRTNTADLLAADIPLGTPLLASAPRTSEALRFHEDPPLRKACVEAVEDGGGASFFRRMGWERRLRRLAARTPVTGRLESPLEREQAVRRELAEAKRQIEERTGRPVTHLCYPWHASGPTARRIAAEVGYRTAFCGKVPGVPITLVGGDPSSIARIGEDYVELLPGEGRGDLLSVLGRKWRRRVLRQPS
jgi:peptidoglycan/xylan/chitin deacetylase (PgdA/CDA1 family)